MGVDNLWITPFWARAAGGQKPVWNGQKMTLLHDFRMFRSYPQAAVSLWITFEFG